MNVREHPNVAGTVERVLAALANSRGEGRREILWLLAEVAYAQGGIDASGALLAKMAAPRRPT